MAKISARNFKIILSLLVIVILASGAVYLWKRPHYRPTKIVATIKPVTITGEVVDAWCYASQTMGPGRGPGHRACALNCIHGGVSVGILEDGTNILFIAAKYRGFKGCQELLLPYVGEKVTVTGWVGDLGGSRMLRIQTVKALTGPTVEVEVQEVQEVHKDVTRELEKPPVNKTDGFSMP